MLYGRDAAKKTNTTSVIIIFILQQKCELSSRMRVIVSNRLILQLQVIVIGRTNSNSNTSNSISS
jgi:hypothetical protein